MGSRFRPGYGGEVMVAMEIEAAAVIRVAARAGHDIDGAVARQAAGRIEVDRGDLKFLHDILGNLKENANRAGVLMLAPSTVTRVDPIRGIV